MKDLSGDRQIEWGYAKKILPRGNLRLLEVGPIAPNAPLSRMAVDRGYDVTAIGLDPIRKMRGVEFIRGDLRRYLPDKKFDWVLNISTIEHFGLAGRYGVEISEPDADLEGMRHLLRITSQSAMQILTVPVGKDEVFSPMHRVYGDRLKRLLWGWEIAHSVGYIKLDKEWTPVPIEIALNEKPTKDPWYYGIGCFLLMKGVAYG